MAPAEGRSRGGPPGVR
eukprot:gene26862-biopygen17447